MKEFLSKLNIVSKNNHINELERDNERKEKQIEKYVTNSKRAITELEIERRKNIETIEQLTKSNKELQDANNSYKNILERIPNWIIRIFAGKKNVGGYLYGGK